MSVMDLASVTKLVSGEGWGLLQSLPPYDESSALSLGEGLRLAGFDADLVAAALTQSRLRAKGHDKFGEFADGMLFTADGLEQATRLEIAARHAQRFRGGRDSSGVRPLQRHRRRCHGLRGAGPEGNCRRHRRGDSDTGWGQPAALARGLGVYRNRGGDAATQRGGRAAYRRLARPGPAHTGRDRRTRQDPP